MQRVNITLCYFLMLINGWIQHLLPMSPYNSPEACPELLNLGSMHSHASPKCATAKSWRTAAQARGSTSKVLFPQLLPHTTEATRLWWGNIKHLGRIQAIVFEFFAGHFHTSRLQWLQQAPLDSPRLFRKPTMKNHSAKHCTSALLVHLVVLLGSVTIRMAMVWHWPSP